MGTIPRKIKNRCKFISSKKGVVEFVFSKLAFLVFGIIIASAFFHIISVQKNIENLDKLARTSDSISGIITMVSASPYPVWIIYESELDANVIFNEQNFTIYTNTNLTRTTYVPINSYSSEKNIPVSCLNISNSNGTVIKKCL